MKRLLYRFVALSLGFASPLAFSADAAPVSDMEQVLKNLVEENQLIGTQFVAIVNEEGLVSFDKFSQETLHFDENSQFLIASHTKAMTSTLAALLHANEEIDLNKPVVGYNKNLITNHKVDAQSITLKQLLTHTSGFTSIQHSFRTAYLGYSDQAELVNALNFNTLVAPNKGFRYSNTGPIVAAMAFESTLGKPWQNLLNERIFSPLGMTNTTHEVTDKIFPSIVTAINGTRFLQGQFKTNQTMHASGGLASTVADLSRWLQANIKQNLGNEKDSKIFEMMHNKQVEQDRQYFTYQRTGYTLGWDVAQYNAETLLTRFGTYAGYSIHVSFMPEKKIGVISFTNQDIAFLLPHVIANYAYNTMLSKDNTQSLLAEESQRLQQFIDKQRLSAPSPSQIVPADGKVNSLIGSYLNTQNWPQMTIYVEDNQIKVSWGVLEGVLLNVDGEYVAHFGSISRPITTSMNDDGKFMLTNGSLVYQQQ